MCSIYVYLNTVGGCFTEVVILSALAGKYGKLLQLEKKKEECSRKK